ncbi:MAG: hypothetical protein H6746_15720 [Deltaproteobacteria bacterium]|nr:hypothetical protein [Deltaproteobacteria bacterium]
MVPSSSAALQTPLEPIGSTASSASDVAADEVDAVGAGLDAADLAVDTHREVARSPVSAQGMGVPASGDAGRRLQAMQHAPDAAVADALVADQQVAGQDV